MKNSKFFLFLFLLFSISQIYGTTWTVTASGMSFSPQSVSVVVGDTVKWVWVDGSHTTTSGIIPGGALTWSHPLDAANTSFSLAITHSGTYNYFCIPHQSFGMTGTINASPNGIKPVGTAVPAEYGLSQNFPNPFNPTTNIRFDLPENTHVKLVIYDVQGRVASELIDRQLNAGSYNYDWDASAFPSGVYFYLLSTDNFSAVKKMVLVK